MNPLPLPPLAAAGFPDTTSRAVQSRTPGHPRRLRLRHILAATAITGFAGILLLAATLFMSFRFGGGARTLRQAALEASQGGLEPQIEFGVGRLPSLIAKAGLSLVDLPPEARAAIGAFESADVGIYRWTPVPGGASVLSGLLGHISAAMAKDGWEPVVRVRDGRETIAVFLPRDATAPRRLEACILVNDGDELVIVSAAVDPLPLLDLALKSRDGDKPAIH